MTGNLIPAAIGFVLFAAFVGFLALKVAAPPLLVIIAVAVLMCFFDFWRSIGED